MAQDRSEVNDEIVVFSVILEDIWGFYKLIKKNESDLKHKCKYDNLLPKNTLHIDVFKSKVMAGAV